MHTKKEKAVVSDELRRRMELSETHIFKAVFPNDFAQVEAILHRDSFFQKAIGYCVF